MAKKKYTGLIVLVVLLAVGLFFSGGVTFEVVDGCQFIEPDFARIECEPLSSTPIQNEYQMSSRGDWGWAGYTTFDKCGDDENSNRCSWYFSANGNPSLTSLGYRFCSVAWDESTCGNWIWLVPNPTEYVGQGEYQLSTNQPIGKIIQVWTDCGILGIGCNRDNTPKLLNKYIPYGLNVYDSGQKIRYNVQSCDLGDLSWTERNDVCTKSDGAACAKIKDSDRLGFDDWVNYLSSWTYAPIDLSNKVVTYNGQQAYCQINKVYSIGEFETASNCYSFPKTLLGSVDCCPGMETANSRCDENFQWQPIVIGECQSNSDCVSKYGDDYYCNIDTHQCVRTPDCISDLQCPGQGIWTPDYSSSTPRAMRFTCQSGSCVSDFKDVDCIPPNTGCEEGYVCDPNKGFICVRQEGPDIVCGDGICSTPFEDVANCPADCELPEELMELIPYVVLGALSSLLFYAKKKEKVWLIIGGIIGLILAWILVSISTWWQSLGWFGQLLLGLGTFGGIGIFVYLFGGTILLLIYMGISKK